MNYSFWQDGEKKVNFNICSFLTEKGDNTEYGEQRIKRNQGQSQYCARLGKAGGKQLKGKVIALMPCLWANQMHEKQVVGNDGPYTPAVLASTQLRKNANQEEEPSYVQTLTEQLNYLAEDSLET